MKKNITINLFGQLYAIDEDAYELLKKADDIEVVVFEESECMGGISKTVTYKGNRMDMGGHRFFSKIPGKRDHLYRALLGCVNLFQVMKCRVPAAIVDKYNLIIRTAAIEGRNDGILERRDVFCLIIAGNYQ